MEVNWADLAGQLEWAQWGAFLWHRHSAPPPWGPAKWSRCGRAGGRLGLSGRVGRSVPVDHAHSEALQSFHTLRNCCPPGFYQDNIECPYFTSEMFSSDVQLGRGSPAPQIVASVPSSRGCVSTKRRSLLRVVAFASLLEPCVGSQLLTLPLGLASGRASVVSFPLPALCLLLLEG